MEHAVFGDLKLKRAQVIRLARSWDGPMAARVVAGAALKPMTIDALLRWAYVQELPKTPRHNGPGGFGEVWRMVEDAANGFGPGDNGFGVVPDFFAASLPHDDALLVHEAVCRLDECLLALPDEWSPVEDLGDLGGHAGELARDALDDLTSLGADGVRRLRRSPRRLVVRHALLAGAPEWRIDAPEIVEDPKLWVLQTIREPTLTGFVERDVEVDGYDKVLKEAKPGAYRKTRLEPDPRDMVVSRAEYEVWRAALDVLFEDLRGTLSAHEVLPCALPMRPWEEGEAAPARVLEDLTPRESVVVRGRRKKISGNA